MKFVLIISRQNPSALYGDDFHIYEMTWSQEGFQFFVDKEKIGEVYPPKGNLRVISGRYTEINFQIGRGLNRNFRR